MRTFFALLVFCATPVYAAELTLSASEALKDGSPVLITISLDTQGENINALEGELSYPKAQFSLREIRDGNSLINFWLERPSDTDGTIRFVGITPGGFSGSGREVFSLLFDVRKAGEVRFKLGAAHAFRNDGEATPVPLLLSPNTLIEKDTKASYEISAINDTTPPEPFTITRSSDPSLFNGTPFIVFATQDKQSGIARYEITGSSLRMRWPLSALLKFEEATSPHPMPGDAYIYVKAVDRAGNERLAVLSPDSEHFYDDSLMLLGILLLLVVIIYRYARRSLLSS